MRKSNLAILLPIIFLVIVFAIPIYAASHSFSFDMQFREVNGSKNGRYYSFDAGNITIKGEARHYAVPSGSTPKSNVSINVYQKRSLWADRSLGMHKIPLSTKVTDGFTPWVSFSKTYTNQPKGKYYIVVSRPVEDGACVRGYGTITGR